jgi:hypothetical protein
LTFVERFAGAIVSLASLAVGLVTVDPVGEADGSMCVEDWHAPAMRETTTPTTHARCHSLPE